MLSEYGYSNILEVSNGQDAVDTCIKENPDLVLLDIVMPVKDGNFQHIQNYHSLLQQY